MINNPPQADYVEPTFEKFMHSVNLECFEQLGLDVDDLADINFHNHYESLSSCPSWGEWDRAVMDAIDDLKEENGVDW
tara:strand:+ start:32 stop:265 length:234 start_codon:yes stop_codon:yes gene_type:complete